VHLASLVARRRQLADHISMAQTELEHLDGEITSQRRTLAARQLYKPALASRERCLQLASLVLGHQQPREFQIVAACALHEERDVFVVQRAGLGKSMCFILAGLMGPSPPSSLPSGQACGGRSQGEASLSWMMLVISRMTSCLMSDTDKFRYRDPGTASRAKLLGRAVGSIYRKVQVKYMYTVGSLP
jgi:hypothetical protein